MSLQVPIEQFLVKPGSRISISDFDTDYEDKTISKKDAEKLLAESRKELADMQDLLYAHNRYRILIIFQAMDAAGKDSAVKHVMSGMNPLGVKVHSFKAPTAYELDHDYFWRHYQALPARGEIALHNRSHYENVLVTRVHPEYVLNERIPGIDSIEKINDDFWKARFDQINRFESNLAENGTVILKFFLHVSKDEQKQRFLERIDDPTKNWKFSMGDLKERKLWDRYQHAYQETINATSHQHSPWFIVPADQKWYTRLVIADIICKQFNALTLSYPELDQKQREELDIARKMLTDEG